MIFDARVLAPRGSSLYAGILLLLLLAASAPAPRGPAHCPAPLDTLFILSSPTTTTTTTTIAAAAAAATSTLGSASLLQAG